MERACRICGCVENRACMTEAGPCHWIESRLCSAPGCATHARAITEADKPLVAQLVEEQREALLATGSYEQRAELFQVAVGTIKSRINRGRTLLAKLREKALEAA